MIRKLKNNKGITLIALVITIVVLLILAGVAISMLSGDNGILRQAANAKEETGRASEEESVKLAVMTALTAGKGELKGEEALKTLNKELREVGYTGDDIVEGNFPATIKIGENTYSIEANGNVVIGDVKDYIVSWNLGYNESDPTSPTSAIVGKLKESQTYEGYYELVIEGTGKMAEIMERATNEGTWTPTVESWYTYGDSGVYFTCSGYFR